MSVTQRKRGACLAAALLGAGGLLAGCARGVSAAGGPSPVESTVAATASPSGSPAAQPEASASQRAPAAGPQACRSADLSVSVGLTQAGVGHRSEVLVFRSRGGRPCRLQGYPGVAALTAVGTNREQVVQATRRLSGYFGGVRGSVPVVTLAPGQTASAMVEAAGANPDGTACTPYRGLLVAAPGDTAVTRLPWDSDGCASLEVHPVVPGAGGRSG